MTRPGELSRRDVAAMELCLGRIRWLGGMPDVRWPTASLECLEPLRYGDAAARDVRRAADRAVAQGTDRRLLRARLALLLRVLLRADRDEMYEHEPRYFHDCRDRFAEGWTTDRLGNWWRPIRVRPLWEDAPPAGTRRARRAG